MEKKFISCGENFMHFHGWFMVLVRQFFDPMVLVRGIASKSVDPKYCVIMVLDRGIVKGLRL